MGALLCCCRTAAPHTILIEDVNLVRFSNMKGSLVRASNWSVAGQGVCVANSVLIQTRSHWEMTVAHTGTFCVGVTRRSNEGLEGDLAARPNSWCLSSSALSDGAARIYQPGDVLSVSYDLSGIRAVLSFSLNGVSIDVECAGIRGDVYPAVSVGDGAVLQANFGATPFKYAMPEGFSTIILSKDLI
jgi:hypothetical protein